MLFAAACSGAQAQSQTPAAAATSAPDALEEITVTAQKRSENSQRTPLAISVISGDSLAQQGFQNLKEVLSDTPAVQPLIGPGGMSYYIRGLGVGRDAPLASTFIDGVVAGSTGPTRYVEYSNYDIARIEVLEGPQGTLYGRNTVSGAVNIVPNEPTNKYEGSATLGYGNYNDLTANGMLNIPLNDWVQMRAAFSTTRRDGFMSDNQTDQNYTAGRLKFLITPTDRLTIHLTGDYMFVNEHGNGEALDLNEHPDNPWLTPNITIPGVSAGLTNYCAILPISGAGAGNTGNVNNTQSQCQLDYYLQQMWHVKGQVDYDFGFADLTVVGGFEHDWTQQYTQAVGLYPNSSYNQDNQTSVETRLTSSASSFIKWVVGAYWQRNLSGFPDGLGGTSSAGARINNVTGNWPAAQVDAATRSVFGQGTLPITDRLRLTGGVRYNKDHTSELTWSVPSGVGSQTVPSSEGVVTRSITPSANSYSYGYGAWNKVIWKGGLEFDLTPQSLLYGSVSTGYSAGLLTPTNVCTPAYPFGGTAANPGCYNSAALQNATTGGTTVGKYVASTFSPVQPNALTSYEIGTKNRFFNDRLQINADVFYMHFSNFQQGAFHVDATGSINGATYADLKGTESRGVELTSAFLATPVDRITVSATYNQTRIGDPNNPWSNPFSLSNGFQTCVGTDALHIPLPYGCHQPVTANAHLPLAPLWSGNVAYQHTFGLPSGADIVARTDTHFQSATWGTVNEFPDSFQASWAELNMSLTYESADGKYRFSGWVRNLADRAIIVNGTATSTGKSQSVCQPTTPALVLSCGGTPVFVDVAPPRTFGFTVSANF